MLFFCKMSISWCFQPKITFVTDVSINCEYYVWALKCEYLSHPNVPVRCRTTSSSGHQPCAKQKTLTLKQHRVLPLLILLNNTGFTIDWEILKLHKRLPSWCWMQLLVPETRRLRSKVSSSRSRDSPQKVQLVQTFSVGAPPPSEHCDECPGLPGWAR